ncbi:MAG: acetate--CoA ligase family protein, partial [Desulfovibrio sp.]|nr:acetate--CoA ligase family protein [Desulfovibrio sp.]
AELFGKCNGKAVMKIVSPDILHKTDAGGVALNIDSPEKAMVAYDRIMQSCIAYKPGADIFGILVTEQLPGGVECIIGSSHDSTFGPTVMFGLGGIFVEVLKDVAFCVAPVNKPSADRMITEIRGLGMLKGARGQKPCDLDALSNAVSVVSYMVTELSDIAEVDMNPVFALEKGLAVADARIVLKQQD